MKLPRHFIAVGKDGKSRHILAAVPVDEETRSIGLPDTGAGLILYELPYGEEQEYGAIVEDEIAEKSTPLAGIWYFDERAIDSAIKMLEACKEFFKKEPEEKQT